MTPLKFRMRRRRGSESMRALTRETRLHVTDLVLPIFVAERESDAGPVSSMPGVERYAVCQLERFAERLNGSGVLALMLFGIPAKKDAEGSGAWNDDGVVCQALRQLRELLPDLTLIADVCLCEYTSHGHCGMLNGEAVDNDRTLVALQKAALAYARAGADIVAPSGMMDGMVAAIRNALDENDQTDTAILSYAVKYASAFYGPFRDAADCAPSFGDRRTHQMDPANHREAQREAEIDLQEGADMLMVKPALSYLDVLSGLHHAFKGVPLAAYQVSGEYSMIKAAAANGWIDERKIALETLLSIKRAGADMILTYFALDAARWLHQDS